MKVREQSADPPETVAGVYKESRGARGAFDSSGLVGGRLDRTDGRRTDGDDPPGAVDRRGGLFGQPEELLLHPMAFHVGRFDRQERAVPDVKGDGRNGDPFSPDALKNGLREVQSRRGGRHGSAGAGVDRLVPQEVLPGCCRLPVPFDVRGQRRPALFLEKVPEGSRRLKADNPLLVV